MSGKKLGVRSLLDPVKESFEIDMNLFNHRDDDV